MTGAQLEHAPTIYTDSPRAQDAFDRLSGLVEARHREIVITNNKRRQLRFFAVRWPTVEDQAADRRAKIVDQLEQSEQRRARVELGIIEVARMIMAEADVEGVEGAELRIDGRRNDR